MERFVETYFKTTIEYPRNILADPLPMNTLREYISSTFLDGFINYVEIKKAFVIGRYTKWDEEPDNDIHIMEPAGSREWKTFKPKTKLEAFNLLTEKDRVFHSNLDTAFSDDVLLLAKDSDVWVFFWYDRDCSDSCIGRFQTPDSDVVVIDSFVKYVKQLKIDEYYEEEKEIPLHYFSGWLSS